MWTYEHYCATVACIGGWMQELSGVDVMTIRMRSPAISRLFLPTSTGFDEILHTITSEEAVQAIDNFTTHSPGNPQWNKVVLR